MSDIKDVLARDNCRIVPRVADWQEAIRVSCEPLLEGEYCTQDYVDAIFESTEKNGPYYVLCENLALIHATNKVGVNGTQLAVTLLDEPVKFSPDGYDVRVLVAFAAVDSDSHIEGIKAISKIFSSEEKTRRLLCATSPDEIYRVFIEAV